MSEDAKETSAAQLQARAKALRLAKSFEAVFGSEGRRSDAQRLVLGHLEAGTDDLENNSYNFREARDGLTMIAAGIHRDGAKSLLRIINRQLKIAATAEVDKKPKPAVKR